MPDPAPIQFNADTGSDFQIGAPTIDGNPTQPNFGMPFGTSMQTGATKPRCWTNQHRQLHTHCLCDARGGHTN